MSNPNWGGARNGAGRPKGTQKYEQGTPHLLIVPVPEQMWLKLKDVASPLALEMLNEYAILAALSGIQREIRAKERAKQKSAE